MSGASDHVDPFDDFDLREYRHAVATFVRLMIRARAKAQPRFLRRSECERWGLADITSDPMSLERLLLAAKAAYERLWRDFVGPAGSGGIAPDDPLAEFKEQVVHFMFETPPDELLARLRRNQTINWRQAAQWESLPAIRVGLDALPVFDSTEEDQSACPIILGSQKLRQVTVNGKETSVTEGQWDVLQALVDVYPDTMTKDELVVSGNHTDAVNILKRLTKRDDHWAAVIKLAGSTGGGYGIVRPAAD